MLPLRPLAGAALLLLAAACGSSSKDPTPTGFTIVTTSGAPLRAVAGDAIRLKVVETMSDGSLRDLSAAAKVAWSGPPLVTALDPGADGSGSVPIAPGAGPTAVLLANPGRTDRKGDLAGVVFVLDAGSLPAGKIHVNADVTANGTGASSTGHAAASIDVTGPIPQGDATRGQLLFGAQGANCAWCHGDTGHGSRAIAGGGDAGDAKYMIDGTTYPYPAPGLNAESGNPASDPAWNAALFAMAARADVDNAGVSLRQPMPDWLVNKNAATRQPPTTQDFADMFAFLKTQTQ